MINIFEYLDYRELLKDLYEYHKGENSKFSYRYMGKIVGFKSAGFFTNIVQGRRNISSTMIFNFAKLFKFDEKETQYFEYLVHYNQAKEHSQRKFYYEKVLTLHSSDVKQLTEDQYKYLEKWYNVALRELLNYFPFRGDYRELGKMLNPSISPAEAREAVKLLVDLGLIQKREDHTYELTSQTLTSKQHVPRVATHNFVREMITLAAQSLDRFPVEKRTLSTLTLSLSDEQFKVIEEKLSQFRKEVLDLVQNSSDINKVYQFNFQIFPLSNDCDPRKL